MSLIQKNDVILFQGDSITDAGRARDYAGPNASHALGYGYAMICAAQLLADRPADGLRVLNRGISGNRIVDLDARIKCDLINLKPNVVSILIGVNDTWHEFPHSNGVAVPKYERVYRELLKEVRAALPGVRFVLCEPFILRCGAATDEIANDVTQRRAVTRKLAQEFGAPFVAFQTVFDEAVKQAPPDYWAVDGVHPSPAGHLLMARAWLKAVGHLS